MQRPERGRIHNLQSFPLLGASVNGSGRNVSRPDFARSRDHKRHRLWGPPRRITSALISPAYRSRVGGKSRITGAGGRKNHLHRAEFEMPDGAVEK